MRVKRIVLPLLFFLAVLAIFYFIPTLIKVREVSCRSQFGLCREELSTKIDSYRGRSLKEAKKKIAEQLTSDPLIKDFSLQFRLPDKLEVNIIEGKAKFAIGQSDRKSFSLIDKDGNVIKVQDSTNLPVVYINDKIPNLGENVGKEKLFALETIFSLTSLYQVKEGKIENNSLTTLLPDGVEVVFPLQGDREVLLGGLELILFRLKSEAKDSRIENIRKIDLRFKNPVLQ